MSAQPSNAIGPFFSTVRARYFNTPPGITSAIVKCNATDPGIDISFDAQNRAIRNDCYYPQVWSLTQYQISGSNAAASCTGTIRDWPIEPTCTISETPEWGIGPFSSTIKTTFQNLPPGIDEARIECDANFPTHELQTLDALNSTSKVCNYPAVATTTFYGIDSYDETGVTWCTHFITDYNQPQSCTLTAAPSEFPGPFRSRLTATFTNLEPGVTDTIIKCNPADPGVSIPIEEWSHTATRDCDYPSVSSDTTYIATSSVGGIHPTSCQTQLTATKSLSFLVSPCDVRKCDIFAPTFYSFIDRPNYASSPPQIGIFDPADSCNNGGLPCKNACRVRGSVNNENSCALVEDLTDYDWNDFEFETYVQDLPDSSKIMQVRNVQCDTAALNELTVYFDFPTDKYIKHMSLSSVIDETYGTTGEFLVWPNCQSTLGNYAYFYISDADNEPTNFPPRVDLIPNPIPIQPGTRPPNLNLYGYVKDETSDSNLIYQVVAQSNTSVINCNVPFGDHYVVCNPAVGYGDSDITVAIIDEEGLWSVDTYRIHVGPTFDFGNDYVWNLRTAGSIKTKDLWPYSFDSQYGDA
ncbi:MAG: hypothetical protein ABH863_00260, partial [Candidatus Micrarchaeota archaeon]